MAGRLEINALVVGSGAREDAFRWKLNQSRNIRDVFVAPGNGGTDRGGIALPQIEAKNINKITSFVKDPSNNIGLVIVGPEDPLAMGLVNELNEAGFYDVLGPTKEAAIIESSKIKALEIMDEAGIPHPASYAPLDADDAKAYVRSAQPGSKVIKADGLCQGKGVFLPGTVEEAEKIIDKIMVRGELGDAGRRIVIQEREEGLEASVLAFCDGEKVVPLIPAQDYKRAYDNDQGPNTGGMGAYAPVPRQIISPEEMVYIQNKILQPMVDVLRRRGIPYKGILYAGLMKTKTGFKVLEFNCRGGDPETQVILPLLQSDLSSIALSVAQGKLRKSQVIIDRRKSAVGVVLASDGYPGSYKKGEKIYGLDHMLYSNVLVFHAGTKQVGDETVTSGGRVLTVVGIAPSVKLAIAKAYDAAEGLYYNGKQLRHDIGAQGLIYDSSSSSARK